MRFAPRFDPRGCRVLRWWHHRWIFSSPVCSRPSKESPRSSLAVWSWWLLSSWMPFAMDKSIQGDWLCDVFRFAFWWYTFWFYVCVRMENGNHLSTTVDDIAKNIFFWCFLVKPKTWRNLIDYCHQQCLHCLWWLIRSLFRHKHYCDVSLQSWWHFSSFPMKGIQHDIKRFPRSKDVNIMMTKRRALCAGRLRALVLFSRLLVRVKIGVTSSSRSKIWRNCSFRTSGANEGKTTSLHETRSIRDQTPPIFFWW